MKKQVHKRNWQGIFIMFMLALLSAAPAHAQEETKYGLKIAGVEVTSGNCNSLSTIKGVKGKIRYEPSTKTLTLENVSITNDGAEKGILNEKCTDLNIKLVGLTKINTRQTAIQLDRKTNILGDGLLRVRSEVGDGIHFNKPLTIENCAVYARGYHGISGEWQGDDILTVRNSYIETIAENGAICNCEDLKLEGCYITSPIRGVFEPMLGGVAVDHKLAKRSATIVPDDYEKYKYYICGDEITSVNCRNLAFLDQVKEGNLSYNPETNTLTMQDVIIKSSFSGEVVYIPEGTNEFKINLIGANYIYSVGGAVTAQAPCRISGPGTLNVKTGDYGLAFFKAPMTIENCKVYVEGSTGICGFNGSEKEVLTVRNACVESNATDYSMRSIRNLKLEGCSITYPSGAVFDAEEYAVVLGDEWADGLVRIAPDNSGEDYGFKVAGVNVTSQNYKKLEDIDGVSGYVYYEPTTNTLVLDNANIEKNWCGIENYCNENLIIHVRGNSSVKSTMSNAMSITQSTKITGRGLLELSAEDYSGISVSRNALNLEESKIAIAAKKGIVGSDGGQLSVRSSDVDINSRLECVIGISAFAIDNCKIVEPKGAEFKTGLADKKKGIAVGDKLVTGKLSISSGRYGLEVAGVEVTEGNKNDLLVIEGVTTSYNGLIKYNPETKTLTLDRIYITAGLGIDNYGVDGLTIKLEGRNDMYVSSGGLKVSCPTTVVGPGLLVINSSNHGNAIGCLVDRTTLTLDRCTLKDECNGYYGILGLYQIHKNHLVVRRSEVRTYGYGGSVFNFGSVELEGCEFTQPTGAMFDKEKGTVVCNGESCKETVYIEPYYYGLLIEGDRVSSANCDDLSLLTGLSSGKGSYDPDTKTLVLDNAFLECMGTSLENRAVDDLKINLAGKNKLYSMEEVNLYVGGKTTISGDGTLDMEASDGDNVLMAADLTLNACDMTMLCYDKCGFKGVNGGEVLTINNCNIEIDGKAGGIANIGELLLNGCQIVEPVGAAYDKTLKAVALDGEIVKGKVVIKSTGTNSIESATGNASLCRKGIYTIEGLKVDGEWENLPTGIYIVDGVKMIK